VGGFHTCVVTPGGGGVCWGQNNFGQAAAPPVNVTGQLKWISAGWHHTCAVNLTGHTHCWGRKNFYMRGGQHVPDEIARTKVKTVSVGYDHTCVLKDDAGVNPYGTPYCWGWGSDMPGVDGRPDSTKGAVDGGFKQAMPPSKQKMRHITSGRFHSCGILGPGVGTSAEPDGAGKCWGRNDFNQCGTKLTNTDVRHSDDARWSHVYEVPASIQVGNLQHPLGKLHTVSAGTLHTCAIRSDGERGLCWGSNANGQVLYPTSALNLPWHAGQLKVISAGESHNCAIRHNGHVVCWGFNHYGQTEPVPSIKMQMVGVGDFHSCATSMDGKVTCWGWNNFGQSAVPATLGDIKVC